MPTLKSTLRYAATPLVLLLAFLSFSIMYRLLDLPSPEALVQLAKDYYFQYGYWVVFLGALAEGILVANWYLPGSAIIVLGVLFFGEQRPLNVFSVVSIVIVGFFITSIVNYAMGRYGWYRLLLKFGLGPPLEKIKQRVANHGLLLIFSTYFHPNVGALTATSCGILRLPFVKFLIYSLVALTIWNLLWGATVFLLGRTMLKFLTLWMAIPVLVVWIIIAVIRSIQRPKDPDMSKASLRERGQL